MEIKRFDVIHCINKLHKLGKMNKYKEKNIGLKDHKTGTRRKI